MGNFLYNTMMFIVNFVFFLAGAAVMSFGIILLVSPSIIENIFNSLTGYQNINYIIDLNSALSASGILLTVVGSVIMCISLIGLFTCCCGGSCLYVIYSVFLGLIIAFEIAVIIYSSVNYTNIQDDVEKYMYSALEKNFSPVQITGTIIQNSTSPGGAAWETMQFSYGCCGANGPQDFIDMLDVNNWNKNFTYNPTAVFPPSCCMQIIQYQYPTQTTEFVDLNLCLNASLNSLTYVNSKSCSIVAMGVISKYGYITNIVIASLIALEVTIMQLTIHQHYNHKMKENKIGYS